MQVSREVVVASIQVDLDDDVLARFREELLHRVQETGSRGVILDVSGLEILDSEEFDALRRIMTMISIMGAEAVLAGLQPGVVSALIEAGADTDGVRAAINLDAAFALLRLETGDDAAPTEEPGATDDADADPDARDAES